MDAHRVEVLHVADGDAVVAGVAHDLNNYLGVIDVALAMMKTEEAKKVWSAQQLQMITALHMFAASYFAGHAKITNEPEAGSGTAAKGTEQAPAEDLAMTQPPQCPPEQKQKVETAIKAYVQAAQGPAQ